MSGPGKPKRPKVVAFDIIGTIFPLDPLRPLLAALGLPADGLESWFAHGLRDAFALSAAGDFAPFTTVLDGALDQVLADHHLSARPESKAAVLDEMRRLVPRPDARDAFETIRQAGLRIIAVSNGAGSATRSLLERSELDRFVEHIVSVDDIRVFKPRHEVYDRVVQLAGVDAASVALVAVHGWDINGAKAAGLTTAFLSAQGPFPAVMREPDLEAPSLAEVARALIAL